MVTSRPLQRERNTTRDGLHLSFSRIEVTDYPCDRRYICDCVEKKLLSPGGGRGRADRPV